MKLPILSLVLSTLTAVGAVPVIERQQSSNTAMANLANPVGSTEQLASGFIYGWPDNGTEADNSIPDYLAKDIKFNACRAGGAQISAPGWASGGIEGYKGRFDSALSNYRTTRKYGGQFILLVHDLWGADGGQGSQSPFPGDNGNWTEVELFLEQLITDIKANQMLDGLVIDIWNEPDLDLFWTPSWSQFVDYYVRATKIVRSGLADTLISGPSMAHSPSLTDENWKVWMSSTSEGNAAPDIYSWHQIGSWERQPDTTIPDFNTLRETYNLPERGFEFNEYAWTSEQNPANSVYYIAQCERHNARCLRANWGGGSDLHNWMANLVYSSDGRYYPNGEWQLYNYYAGMDGAKVQTTASADQTFDVFATTSGGSAKILAGTRTVEGLYNIQVSGISALGLPQSGKVDVHIYRFDWTGNQGEISGPVDLGLTTFEYNSDQLDIPFDPETNSTAYAFEFGQ